MLSCWDDLEGHDSGWITREKFEEQKNQMGGGIQQKNG